MTNPNNNTKSASAATLLAVVAVAPFFFSSCGGLSKSDRETVNLPPVAVGAATGDPDLAGATAPRATATATTADVTPTPAAPPYSLDDAVPYVVESGDSLSVIAAKHGVSMRDVMMANNIKDANKIRSGQTLLLPPKKGETGEATATEATATEATPIPADATETPSAEDASGAIDPSALRLPALGE